MAFTKEQIEKLGITYTDGMTDDDVVSALSKKHADFESEKAKQKSIIDKYSSEIKTLKDDAKAKLSDEEQKKLQFEEMQNKIATLEKEKAISVKKNQYLKMGYSDDLAQKVAQGEMDGQDVSEYHKQFLKEHDEAFKKELLKQSPTPTGAGEPTKKWTKEGFKKGEYSYEELCDLQEKNPTLFKEITE